MQLCLTTPETLDGKPRETLFLESDDVATTEALAPARTRITMKDGTVHVVMEGLTDIALQVTAAG
jgi:hypothetical protein